MLVGCRQFIIAMLMLCALGHTAQADNRDHEAQLRQLKKAISKLHKQLSAVKSDRDRLQQDLADSELKIANLRKKIRTLNGEIKQGKTRLSNLIRQQQQLTADKKIQQIAIAQQINTSYRLGGDSRLKLLLNQEQPDSIARIQRFYRYLTDDRAAKIDQFNDTLKELAKIKLQIESENHQLIANRQRLDDRRSELEIQQQQRGLKIARIDSDIEDRNQRLAQLNNDRERLQELVVQVRQAIINLKPPGNNEPFQRRKGKMTMPTKGKLVRSFGSSRNEGLMRWQGVVIRAPEGASVNAIHHGRVVYSDYLRGHGLLTIIDHGNGYMSLYAHNQALLKEAGDWVGTGDIIARVGNSGGQKRPGLYFEVRHDGNPVNPSQWCRRT